MRSFYDVVGDMGDACERAIDNPPRYTQELFQNHLSSWNMKKGLGRIWGLRIA